MTSKLMLCEALCTLSRLIEAEIPSSVEMLVYRLLMSIVTSILLLFGMFEYAF